MGGVSVYSCTSCGGNVGLCKEREGGDSTVRRQSEHALVQRRDVTTTCGVKGTRGGGSFVLMSALGDELDREGAGCGYAAHMGTLVHSAYMVRS
jgi:hypothetical protein